ncbi:MAG TPA: lytic transglycosylase domain-containing protein [Longimicrobiales bacterium]|nr:lytic transglycosylase domain-containing protein [Longimicrobiales bacterium]
MSKRDDDSPNNEQGREAADQNGVSLPGDLAGGAGPEWRGKLERLRESRRQRRRGMRRLREPLIGLTMAGAAAPIAHAVRSAEPAPPDPERATDPAMQRAQGDVEDAVGERWADAKAAQDRENMIVSAMSEYDIDRGLAESIYDISQEEGVDADVAYGLVKTESTFRTRAVSYAGARGLTQVLPSTARWMMPEIRQASQLFQPETNLRVGFRYLRYLVDKYDGNTHLALLAYNRGPGTVDRILDRGGNPDNGYAGKVLRG